MELDGDLVDPFALAFVSKPCMGDIRSDKDQFQVVDLFHTIPYDPFYAFCIFDKIQFIFFVVMHREIKLCFIAGKHRETIGLR